MLTLFRHYGLSIATAMTILFLCTMRMPDNNLGGDIPEKDKIVHIVLFALLSAAICKNFFQEYTDFGSLKMYIWGIAIPVLYGGLIEIIQGTLLSAYRSADWFDLLSDAIGTLLAYGLCAYFYPRYMDRNIN